MTEPFGQHGSGSSYCPRCGTTLHRLNQTFCTNCGLNLACSKCRERLEEPLGNSCQKCGASIEQRPWRGVGPSRSMSAPQEAPTEQAENLYLGASAPALAAPALPEEVTVSIAAESVAQTPLAAYKRTASARQLRADLGVALSRRGQFREADESFGRALQEQGARPGRFQLLLLLAYAQEAQGAHEEAFRAYLEAVLEQPQQVKPLLANAHRLLTPATALNQGGWVTREWAERAQILGLDSSSRVQVSLFLARLNLFLNQYDRAVELCRETSKQSPERAHELSSLIVGQDALPPVWRERPEGNAQLILARLNQALGRFKEALAAIDSAIGLGLSDETRYPDAPALRLRGEILEQLGDVREAAKAFFESGQHYQWRSEYESSTRILRQSLELDRDYAPTYWYLANALYMLSGTSDKGARKERLGEAWDLWEAGYGIQQPDPTWSWVYVLGALVRSSLSEAHEERGLGLREHLWEAVTYIERALLLNQDEARWWAFLGGSHRSLENQSAAVHATGVAMERNNEDTVVLQERATVLGDLGAFEAAEPAIERLRQLSPSHWADAVKAFILMFVPERRDEAMGLIETAVRAQPDDTWYREVRALGRQLQGEPDGARSDYEFLYEKLGSSRINSAFAWAAYNLDRIPEAIQSYQDRLERDVGWTPTFALRGLGLCHLRLGDAARARSRLDAGIEGAINIRELDEFLHAELTVAERKLQDQTGSSELRDLLTWARNKAVERRDQLTPKSSTLEGEELAKLAVAELQRTAEGRTETNWSWCGARAGLARLSAQNGRWAEAAEIYQLLLQRQPGRFPEARLGLEKACDGLVAHSDALFKDGQSEKAREQITRAFNVCDVSMSGGKKRQADLHARMALIHFSSGAFPASLSDFAKALQLYREEGEASPGDGAGRVCRSLLRDPSHYWALDGFLESAGEGPSTEEILRDNLAAMRRSFEGYLDEFYQLSAQSGESSPMIPVVTPVAVEIAKDLLPEDTGPEWSLFKTYIPQMRDRIERDLGVRTPGVRIRSDEGYLPTASYLIMLDEVPIVLGSVQGDRRYCPSPPEALRKLGIPGDAIVEASHPLTGEPGSWLGREHWDPTIKSGLELCGEPLAFMVYHLEAVLRRNLADFLGVQEVENLLETWEHDKQEPALVQAALPEPASRLCFARVLRELAKERVPVTDWKGILEVVRDNPLTREDVSAVVRAIRLRLKAQLPGNSSLAEHLELPAEVEAKITAWLRIDDGKIFLAMPPEETQEVISDIRELVGRDYRNQTLVIRDSVVRPFVRRLVELEWPDLMVLSLEEMEPKAGGGAQHEARA